MSATNESKTAKAIKGKGGPERHAAVAMPKGSGKIIKRLVKFIFANYKWAYLVVLLCIVVSSITNVISTMFMQTLIDDYITPLKGQANPDFGPLALTLVKLAIILAIGTLCSYANNWIMIYVSQGNLRDMRLRVFKHMETLPLKYFDQNAHGDIMSVYTNDIDTLRELVGSSVPQIFNTIVSLVFTLFCMIKLSVPLTIMTLVFTVMMYFTTKWLSKLSGKYFRSQQSNLGAANGYIEEILNGQKVVKSFCHEDEAISQFEKLNEALRSSTYNANKTANIVMPINGNISNLIYVLSAIIGAILALNGHVAFFAGTLTVGTLVAFLNLCKSFTRPISNLSQQINSIVGALAGAERVFKVLDEKPEDDSHATITLVNIKKAKENSSKDKPEDNSNEETSRHTGIWAWKRPLGNGKYEYIRQKGKITFKDVDFSYVPDKQVLYDINLTAQPGQKIALVGGTGAGKTTITNLINRFYDIQDGHILYDNIDINLIKRQALRRSLGMVLQETHLFTGTVMDNIRYGRLEATDEECMRAAELVNADDFIVRLADGYNTWLSGDGGNLSQGERQLIAIARAAVADPPALILDEATSSIDTRTEKLVQEGMDSLMKGRTTFVIAHRLSTVKNADCIMVMDHGRIIERGTHDELIALKGKYYQLYTGNQIN